MRKFLAMVMSLGLVGMLAGPSLAQVTDSELSLEFAAATMATEMSNLTHYGQVAAQVTAADNLSCRVERPAFVSQPEVDGRVTVKGEDDAATTVECVDLMLEAQDLIDGKLYIQYLPVGASTITGWVDVDNAWVSVSGRMTKGLGAAAAVLSYVFPANHVSQGRPHRACVDLVLPKDFAPLCQTMPTLKKMAMP